MNTNVTTKFSVFFYLAVYKNVIILNTRLQKCGHNSTLPTK